jgi:hypothetical protein
MSTGPYGYTKGLNALLKERGWEVEVLTLVAPGTEIGQGKGVPRVPEDCWDISGGGEKNHPQPGCHTAVGE